jgi:hypothetical protein
MQVPSSPKQGVASASSTLRKLQVNRPRGDGLPTARRIIQRSHKLVIIPQCEEPGKLRDGLHVGGIGRLQVY